VTLSPGEVFDAVVLNIPVTVPGAFLLISTYGSITSFVAAMPNGGPSGTVEVGILIDQDSMENPTQRISMVPHPSLPQAGPFAQTESWSFTGASRALPTARNYRVTLRYHYIGPPQGPPLNFGYTYDSLFAPSGTAQLSVAVINR
jgi:hypothetical protein